MKRNEREVSDIQIIDDIINRADVCRIALANDNIPYIVTLNFGYESSPERKLYFHCANKGRKLEMIRKNSYVCFEMDTGHEIITGTKACDWGMKYRSVVGYGYIKIINEKAAKKEGLNCIMRHYGAEGEFTYYNNMLDRTTLLQLEITEITGKKSCHNK